MSLQKRTPIRSKRITQAAKGEACTVCGSNDGTTVFCHLNESWAGKGIGQKADDIAGFFGCFDCHISYDEPGTFGRKILRDLDIMRAMYRTWRILWDKGIIGELK
jgi:hypothetical protein